MNYNLNDIHQALNYNRISSSYNRCKALTYSFKEFFDYSDVLYDPLTSDFYLIRVKGRGFQSKGYHLKYIFREVCAFLLNEKHMSDKEIVRLIDMVSSVDNENMVVAYHIVYNKITQLIKEGVL